MNTQTIINQITELCDKNSISINQMLKEAQVNKSLVDNLKKGSIPAIDKIEAIADYFNVSIDYLVGKTNNTDKNEKNIPIHQNIDITQESKENFYVHLESTIFKTDLFLHKCLFEQNSKNHTANAFDYDYKMGYPLVIGNKSITQTIYLTPLSICKESYELLDAIFGESKKKKVDTIRNTYAYTFDNKSKITYTYNFRVSEKNEEEIELACNLIPAKGYQDPFDNLISILKKHKIIY